MKNTPPKPDSDPAPGQRVYYRHRLTADLGYLVWRDGKQCIRYDQPDMDRTVPFREAEWTPQTEHRPITMAAIARVAFEADKALCLQLGFQAQSRLDWLNLRDQERIEFMNTGPAVGAHEARRALWKAVLRTLSPLAK